jgi:hypothetical protein
MEVIIRKSKKKDKKFDAIVDGKKTISFGSAGMSDMTQHKDPERKQRYINRHKKNENWNDAKTAGFYAKHVLWNKPTMQASVSDINKKFPKLKVKLKL